jgi:hypothetical protein
MNFIIDQVKVSRFVFSKKLMQLHPYNAEDQLRYFISFLYFVNTCSKALIKIVSEAHFIRKIMSFAVLVLYSKTDIHPIVF